MEKKRKTPLRMCIGCSEMKEKKSLVRIVKSPTDEISLDPSGKAPGRGAYVCRDSECLVKARKTRRLERSFKGKIPDEVYESLESAMAGV